MVEEMQLTPQEAEKIIEMYGSNLPEGKHNVHTFLHSVATAEDTTKLGNLTETELGLMENSVRAFKELGLFSSKIMRKPELAKFFTDKSEIGTSTSLSRNGTLVKLAITQKKELADVTAPKKENKGWFTKKDKSAQTEEKE